MLTIYSCTIEGGRKGVREEEREQTGREGKGTREGGKRDQRGRKRAEREGEREQKGRE